MSATGASIKKSLQNCDCRLLPPVVPLFLATLVAFLLSGNALSSNFDKTDGHVIRLKVRTVVTSKNASVTSSQSAKAAREGAKDRYYIVQGSQRINKKWRDQVASFSGKVVGYIPDDALLIKASPKQVSRILRLNGARWIGRYDPEYKISPSLGSLAELRHAAVSSAQEVFPLLVSVFPGCDVAHLASAVESAGCQVEESLPGRARSYLKVWAAKSHIPAIAQIEDVEWIEPFHPFVFAGATQAKPLAALPDIQVQIINAPQVWEKGLTGKGQVVAICDTGLDVGVNGTPMHDDFEGRIEAAYALGRPDLWNDPDGHGTHVAGTAVGNGLMSDGRFKAPAQESALVIQSGYVSDDDPLGGVPVNLYDLFQQAYDQTPARIHSNSWGSPDRSAYSLFSVQTDEFVWDHKDSLIVFAAGNDGVDADADGVVDEGSLYSPATAKNCIAVGASENVREIGGLSGYTWGYLGFLEGEWSAEPIADDYVSDNENGMAAFSSRGPCLDRRIKPDLVAPGTDIISCRSQDPQGKQSTALLSWGVYDDYYVYMGGTSMAAPAVAGGAAVVRQFLTEVQRIPNPSAALIKATLINGAADISPGQYGTGPQQEMSAAPNSTEGWGRIDLKQSLYPDGSPQPWFVDQSSGLETGESETYQFVAGNSETPFRATMVYSDYPASPAAAVVLVNDLDMTVIAPGGQAIYPNRGDGPDGLNNVESVNIPVPTAGIYEITISATNAPFGPQPYALVVSCGTPTGRAVVSLDKEAYGQADSVLTITLIDADLTASSTPSVSVTSDSDPKGVTSSLSPSATSPSVFQGSVELSTSAPPSTGSKLYVSHGDTVTVTYTDPSYGGAGSQNVVATATVDLIPPRISGVTTSEINDNSAVISWSCSEPASGSVNYGGSPLLGSSTSDRTLSESHLFRLHGLSENQAYYFSVRVRDVSGNETTDDNGGQFYIFHTDYTVARFHHDMEMGEGAWEHYGDVDQWEHGLPTYRGGPVSAHSGDFCWGTRLKSYLEHDDFIAGGPREEYLVSPEIDADTSTKLTFWHWYDLVADSLFGIYDYAYVEVSADGVDWHNVTPNAGLAYTGATAGWVQEEVDLSPYTNQIVRIRFHLWLEGWFDYLGPDYQHAGWYVDDLTVASTKAFGEPTLTLSKPYCTTAVPLGVTLVDGDLNQDSNQADVAEVTAWSTTEVEPEALLLTETGTNTGVFFADVSFDASPPVTHDGRIQVKEGDMVTFRYENLQAGPLSSSTAAEVVAVVDMTPPQIADLAVSPMSSHSATVSFTTEATAVARISYWGPDQQLRSQTSQRLSPQRHFLLQNLAENSLYRFRISVTDQAGNSATYSSPLDDFSFGTNAQVAVAANAFDGAPSPWDFSTDGVWELGTPAFGPPDAHSPPNCWGTDLDGFYPIKCDASLTSNWVTLPDNPQMHFWHWYGIDELGWEGAYGIVEVSTHGNEWIVASDESTYAGASDGWVPETIDLSTWAGQTVKIRFRLWSEGTDIVLFYYAGWYVDDVSISSVVRYGRGTLVFDRSAYSLHVPVVVTLIDGHLNADPLSKETCLITLSSSLESLSVELVETEASSGRFIGQVYLREGPPALDDDYLQVTPGDSLVAEYHDQDDGGGAGAVVMVTAPLDTTPPLISAVNIAQITDTSALITWSTDVEAVGSVSYGESPLGPFDRVSTESSYRQQHSIRITGLAENVAYYLTVSSADAAQNSAVDDNGGSSYPIRTMVRWEYSRDSFDREATGWTHDGVGDVWQWGVPRYGVMSAHSSPDCWATNLAGTYPGLSDASLVSPQFDLRDGSRLSFWHWYSINQYLLDEGEGTVEIKTGQGDWESLPEGAFAGVTDSWEECEFDLSPYGEQAASLRFRVRADQWIDFFYPGWYIDDVKLYCLRPFGFGVLQLDQQIYPVPGTVTITLKDAHLSFDSTTIETAEITVNSTSDPSGRALSLHETGPNTGVFVGQVRLRHLADGEDGDLSAEYADTITARYLDADNALGETYVEKLASATVWTPPHWPITPSISCDRSSKPPNVTIGWPYDEERAYRVYYCDDLSAQPRAWLRVPGLPKPQGTSLLTYTEPISPLSRKRFYRIEVW